MKDDLQQRACEILDALETARELPDGAERAASLAELQEAMHELTWTALQRDGGPAQLYPLASRFDRAGLFIGSDWDEPEHLQPGLVEHALDTRAGVAIECCSQLRLLAIARGDAEHPRVAADEAREFLEHMLALNLGSLFPAEPYRRRSDTAEGALEPPIRRLFGFVIDSLGVEGIMSRLVVLADRILRTRPIKLEPVRRMLDTASHGLRHWGFSDQARDTAVLVDALAGPTSLCRASADLQQYRQELAGLDEPTLVLEADMLCASMRRTGLVCPQHAVLVRHVLDQRPELLPRALGLEEVGRCSLTSFKALVTDLISIAVHPATPQAVAGLAQMLERGVLYQPSVVAGLRSLLVTPLLDSVAEALLASVPRFEAPSAKVVLMAGALDVLGLPLGVDQGHNPTCQSARAISLWAQNDPGFLLEAIVRAARDDNVRIYFEGSPIDSQDVERGVADTLHPELDSVSLLLTPHLDRIYWEMSRRACGRDQDEHKWVNPEFHGRWVKRGFAAIIDENTGHITAAEDFVRQFYASYHPHYRLGYPMGPAQPAGVAITNQHGVFLDWHAVSIQRVAKDPAGTMRVYFFNPNHDKGQVWGPGVVTLTSNHGEVMGESSLPFVDFAARVYVFHHDPLEQGDVDTVDNDEVGAVLEAIRTSWGASFSWADTPAAQEAMCH